MTAASDFRQTEAGLIPAEWKASTVGAEFDVRLGKMLDAARNVGEPKPYLGNRAVQWGRIDVENLGLVPLTRTEQLALRLRSGDLLVCEGGEVGRAAIWRDQLPECYYQKALHRLRPRNGYSPELMAAYLRYWSDRGALADYVTQTSIAHLPREKLVTVPLPRPPAAEQAAIAAALFDVEALLAKLGQLIAKKRDLKQAAMQRLLSGEMRLPGFTGQCKNVQLADLGAWVGGATPSMKNPAYWTDGDVPWISSGDVTQPLSISSLRLITRRAVMETATKVLPAGSLVLVTRSGILRHTLPIALVPSPVSINQDIKGLIPKPGVYGPFVLQALLESAPRILGACLKAGTTVESIEFRWLKRFQIRLPEEREQRAIAEVLSDMDAELAALEARRDKTRQLKQGMMQALLTGRIRLT